MKKINKENLCRHLHISVMAPHSYKLASQRGMIKLDVQSSEKGQGREPLQFPLILLYSVVAIVIIYAITHTDYTQYINTCNRGQARLHNACSICLVININYIRHGSYECLNLNECRGSAF